MEALEVDAVSVVRSFFLASIVAGIFINSVPFLKQSILNYGTRAQNAGKGGDSASSSRRVSGQPPQSLLASLELGVPHTWFTHYYIWSVSLSIFWAFQLLTQGSIFRLVAGYVNQPDSAPTMKGSQVALLWAAMLLQGLRRLWESFTFLKPSASRMPWSIYAIGVAYYSFLSIAVWIEGAGALLASPGPALVLPLPSPRTTVSVITFILASGFQHDCHHYLADLKKYTLPEHSAFHRVICPHYTAECVIYLALAFMGAPRGHWFNGTLLCNLAFVVVNLGLVADETKRWSERKFGAEKVSHRARMIPYVW